MKKICEVCGKEFQASKSRIKTCSRGCGIKLKNITLKYQKYPFVKICEICGKEFEINHYSRKNVRTCSKECTLTSMKNNLRKVKDKKICEVCGKEFEINNYNSRRTCSKECRTKINSIIRKTKYIEQINNLSNTLNFTFDRETYINTIGKKILLKCNKCGTINEPLSGNFLKGDYINCTKCGNRRTSSGETELTEFIQSLGFQVEKKKFNWGEIDCFIPSLNIGFEYNGCYWHSDLQKDKNYHYDKVTAAQEEGIRLIMIWEYEWINSNRQIKSYIKAQLGLCEHRIYARNCIVRECNYQEIKHLLEYHQQGKTTGSKYYGIEHNNEIILAMIFQKPEGNKLNRFKNEKDSDAWTIKREICKEGYSIVGGKSKVFSLFVKENNPDKVLSYVDRSKFTGKSYQIMGFELEKICEARYDWVYKYTLEFKKRQPAIYKEMMTLYNENKVFRVYDSGRYKYVWKQQKTHRI